jgi:hypothetical protein
LKAATEASMKAQAETTVAPAKKKVRHAAKRAKSAATSVNTNADINANAGSRTGLGAYSSENPNGAYQPKPVGGVGAMESTAVKAGASVGTSMGR